MAHGYTGFCESVLQSQRGITVAHCFTFAVCLYLLLKILVTRASFSTLLCAAVLQLFLHITLVNCILHLQFVVTNVPQPVFHSIVWCSFVSSRQAV